MKKQYKPTRPRPTSAPLKLEIPAHVLARASAPPALDETGLYDLRELSEMKSKLNLRFVEMDGAVPVYEMVNE